MPSDLSLLARRPVAVTVGGRKFSLPYRSAAEWASALESLEFLVTSLADDEVRAAIVDMHIARTPVREDLKNEALRILEQEGGRKWWEVGRLLSTSVSTEVLGHLVLSGVDPWNRSVGEWCAAVYALCLKNQDERGRMKFEFSLSLPPRGYEAECDDGNDIASLSQAYAQALGKK